MTKFQQCLTLFYTSYLTEAFYSKGWGRVAKMLSNLTPKPMVIKTPAWHAVVVQTAFELMTSQS